MPDVAAVQVVKLVVYTAAPPAPTHTKLLPVPYETPVNADVVLEVKAVQVIPSVEYSKPPPVFGDTTYPLP